MSQDIEYRYGDGRRSKGELMKINAQACGCGRIYLSLFQSFKAGINPGWYSNWTTIEGVLETNKKIYAALRIAAGDRGFKVCDNCKGRPRQIVRTEFTDLTFTRVPSRD